MAMMNEKSWKLTLIFSVIWALTLLYGEMFAFWVPVSWTYTWPHLQYYSSSSPSLMSAERNPNDFVKVAVLTDPQLMDRTSHNFAPRSFALEIAQFYTDIYMRRALISTILPFEPDAILFLGDYFDGGPQLSNEEWQESLSRFEHIFDIGERRRIRGIPTYYLSGNHDIGYAWHVNHKPEVVERYESTFGPRNYKVSIGKVDFVTIDAQTIDGNLNDNSTSCTWDFVNNVSLGARSRVLLTHIPLYRPDWTSCGPYRSSDIINQRISRSFDQRIIYQNYVTEESSKRLLDLIQPALVLSGHDHDQCTVTHKTNHGSVKEHTVGTLSWQQGNWYPSFMLLSVANFTLGKESSPAPEILAQLCLLPTQLFVYIWYIILFVITILTLSLWPSYGVDIGHHFSHLMMNMKNLTFQGLFSSGTKEKNEDEDYEYEEIWDAEGGMHLVKKPRKSSFTEATEITGTERGNAVMRTARRQMLQHQETGTKADNDGDPGSTANILPRSNKSITRIALQRCLRVLGMVLVIAVVNVPLYMMLLFKDWIEQ